MKPERALDVLAHLACGGCRERHDGWTRGQGLDEVADALIAGAEVVPPLGDAVCLVHGEQAEAMAADDVEKRRVVKALRGHVDDCEQPPRHVTEQLLALMGAK